MRDLVVIQYASLDGVIQGPGHADEDTEGGFAHGGWTEPLMPEHRRYGTARYRDAGAFLFGRHTYEIWIEYWPKVTDPDNHIAAALNTRPKYVVSTTLAEPTWPGTTVIRDDVPAEVNRLKQQPGGDILVPGSGRLTHTLTAEGLVDRYELWIHPVAIGTGKRLFADRTRPDTGQRHNHDQRPGHPHLPIGQPLTTPPEHPHRIWPYSAKRPWNSQKKTRSMR